MLGRGLVVVQWASNVVKSKAGLSTNQERNVLLGLCCVVGSCYTSGGVALVRAHCGLTNVANLCEYSVGLLSWALRRCPRPNISRHGKTGQNFLTRLEPNFFNPKQKRVDP